MTTGNPFRYQKIFQILHFGCHLPPSFLNWRVVKRQGSSLRIYRYPRFCVVLLPLPVEYFQYFQRWNVMRSNLLDGSRPHFGSRGFITSVHVPHIFEILRMLLQELLGQFPLHPTRKLSSATDQILKRRSGNPTCKPTLSALVFAACTW